MTIESGQVGQVGQASEYKPRSRSMHIATNKACRRVAIHSPWFQETKYFNYEEAGAMRGYFLDLLQRYTADTRRHISRFFLNGKAIDYDHSLRAFHYYGTLFQTSPADIDTLNEWFDSSKLQE